MPFKPPVTAAFKRFVILDEDGVIAALSAIDGGKVDEVLTRSAEERAGELGAELRAGPASGRAKRDKAKRVEEEMRRTRTRHAAAAKLLESLHGAGAIGVVDGPLDEEVAAEVEVGMVVQFRADLRLHPLHQADRMLQSFIEVAPALGHGRSTKELKEVQKVWRILVGTGRTDGRVLLEARTRGRQVPRLLLSVPSKHFEVEVSDSLGEQTVIAQIDRLVTSEEQHSAVRLLGGAPDSSLERSALEEGVPDLIDALSEMEIPISREDIFISGPALLLRVVCAYR